MSFLRALLRRIAPLRWQQRRLFLPAILLAASLILLSAGLTGLLLAKETSPPLTNAGTLDLPRNGLETPTASPIATPTPSSAPVAHMIIEKICVDAPVVTLGLDENNVPQVPDNPNDVVWYDWSMRPGWGSNAVFSGHVDWTVNGVPVTGVFYDLRKVEVGDTIKVTLADNTEYQYKVIGNVAIPYDDAQATEAMGATPSEVITIITCGGTWIPEHGNPIGGHYTHRQIVRAELIRPELTVPTSRPSRFEREMP